MEDKKVLNEEELKNVTGGEIESANIVGYKTSKPKSINNNEDKKLGDWNYVDVEIT